MNGQNAKPGPGLLRTAGGALKSSGVLTSVWAFPVALACIFLVLVSFKVSGSSIGVYNWILGLPQEPSLIANAPQVIRSDEWLVNTQLAIGQSYNNFACHNPNIGGGQDLALIGAPCKDWSALFRPENAAFFFAPLGYALAFRWWFLAYLLVVACYFFVLKILPAKKSIAILLSLALLCSPFIQWWYLTGTLGSVSYSLILATLVILLLEQQSRKRRLLLALAVAYTAVAFVILLYPPFTIACSLAIAALLAGWILEQRRTVPWKELLKRLAVPAAGLAAAIVVMAGFFLSHTTAIQALSQTDYPGNRVIAGGGFTVPQFMSGFVDMQLQNPARAIHAGNNQSEWSNFILLTPFLAIPTIYLLLRRYRAHHEIDWPLLTLTVMSLMLYVRFFTPVFDPLYKLLLLDKVPHQRLLIGIGLLNWLHLVFFIRHLLTHKPKVPRAAPEVYGLATLGGGWLLGAAIHSGYPGLVSLWKAILLSTAVSGIIYILLKGWLRTALFCLLTLSILSTYRIHPLYRGIAVLADTPVAVAIREIGANTDEKWITESIHYENFPLLNGEPSLAGVYQYPQKQLWSSLAPHDERIYNRYAHVSFLINHEPNDSYQTRLKKLQEDSFIVLTEPCSRFLTDNHVRFILAQAPIQDDCVQLLRTVPYPNQIFFIYQLKP